MPSKPKSGSISRLLPPTSSESELAPWWMSSKPKSGTFSRILSPKSSESELVPWWMSSKPKSGTISRLLPPLSSKLELAPQLFSSTLKVGTTFSFSSLIFNISSPQDLSTYRTSFKPKSGNAPLFCISEGNSD